MSTFSLSSLNKKPIILSIEGNIGAGKTTIVEQLEKFLNNIDKRMNSKSQIIFLKEPIDIWGTIKDSNGDNILQNFYANPSKYAFPFQVMAYATRLSLIRQTIRENPTCDMIICERSLDADKFIFAQMLYDDGMIDDMSFQIYQRFYKEYSDDFSLDGIIYIDADAEVCERRINQRSRDGEGGIELAYLQKCKTYHDNWLAKESTDVPVLTIKTNEDVTYDPNDIYDIGMSWLSRIDSFINEFLEETNWHERNNKNMFMDDIRNEWAN